MQIVTATREEAPKATKLEFDHGGVIISKKVASAKVALTRSFVNDSVELLFPSVTYFQHSPFGEKSFRRIANVSSQRLLQSFKHMH